MHWSLKRVESNDEPDGGQIQHRERVARAPAVQSNAQTRRAQMKPIMVLAGELAAGKTTSQALVEDALMRIAAPSGEGARVFLRTRRDSAQAEAKASDSLRAHGIVPSPLAGIPVSVKDLFDVAGDITRAGSKALAHAAPAKADATVVRRLRQAGAIIVGRTNMVEFAFSGIGLNPHYGTPKNPWDRPAGRIPGGSSSGAAVSVSDGMAAMGLGTDTGGSVRIPAALCGLTGFKPSARRIPKDGTFPLSATLDSIGPIARGVACCALVDSILAGDTPQVPPALPLKGLRLGVVQDYVLDGLDAGVADAFGKALARLSQAGASVRDVRFDALRRLPQINQKGGLVVAEAYAVHRELIAGRKADYDPRVASRILRGADLSAADYIDALTQRAGMIADSARVAAPYDALLMPTVVMVAPAIAPLQADDQLYGKTNLALLRNSSVVNFLDGCALSIPCQEPGAAPVGLMVVGQTGGDRRLLAVGLALESALHS
jgi:aspartyl-tRNA(Asn)/glutamyl-tRNA(Gln) amidotransferase subunit A